MSKSDFYIGYQDHAPVAQARFTRRVVQVLILAAVVVAVSLAAAQRAFAPATFEFGSVKMFTGVVDEHPYPSLLVKRPGEAAGWSRYLLVAFGKHGADELVAGLDGTSVSLRGTLIHQDDRTMIEVAAGSVQRVLLRSLASAADLPGAEEELGVFTLRGEIVDSKCHLGVMNPGVGKVHRACATLCIQGGIPPILLARDEDGRERRLLLVDSAGGAVNDRVLSMVADQVEITGEVRRLDDLLVLRADPETYRRLD